MICIECSNPVSSLYLKYSYSNITLTRCAHCGEPCDVYVEYDKVILAIDLILLKPQAFKHLIYNSIIDTSDLSGVLYHRIGCYRSLIRTSLLILLFEVYLNWAYEEKNANSRYSIVLDSENMFYQYSFFIVQTLLKDFIYHVSIQLGLRFLHIIKNNYDLIEFDSRGGFKKLKINAITQDLINPDKTYHYHPASIIVATIILLSSITKLLPILIIIWPYDSSTLSLIMLLIKITNNYFVLTLLHSCFGGSQKKIVSILILSNLLSYSTAEIGLVRLIKCIFS